MITSILMRMIRKVELKRGTKRTQQLYEGPALPPFPGSPVGSDHLPEVHHIVILMMENHSFDSYFGTLGRGEGFPRSDNGDPSVTNHSLSGKEFSVFRSRTTFQEKGVPSQSWEASHEQWGGGKNDGFVRSVEAVNSKANPALALGYWSEENLPFYSGLAKTFPLCDRWFSSCLGPTFPNRRFLISGTAHGLTTDALSEILDRPVNGTLFDLLDRHEISWRNYHSRPHSVMAARRSVGEGGQRFGRKAKGLLKRIGTALGSSKAIAKSTLQFTADCYPLGLLSYFGHIRTVDHFMKDVAKGDLPSVSIVDPDFDTNSEENPQDIRKGEAFAYSIIRALMEGPAWKNTLIIWTYDEHGGYYDHVPPPEAPEPDAVLPRGGGGFRYDRYGFRVPAVIISPYAKPDYVSHIVHDHTSVLKLIETKWNLPSLTRRDAQADGLLDCLDFDNEPYFADPPRLPLPALLLEEEYKAGRTGN